MPYDYLSRLTTPAVAAAQSANGARAMWAGEIDRPATRFTGAEADFIAQRDSFYLASVSQAGWPYLQYRGGPRGFLRVLDDTTLAFADFRGNRQYISLGNIADDDRVSLFLIDYPARRRLKVLARMAVRDLSADMKLSERLATPGYRAVAERAFVLTLEAFDWNCSQHITPRFTELEVEAAVAPMRERLAMLEAEVARLRASP